MGRMRLRSRIAFPRPLVFALLFSLFLLCFIVTPLWNTLPGLPLKAAFLALTLVSAFPWAWWGSGAEGAGPPYLRSPTLGDLLTLLAMAIPIFVWNFPALSASIPWRGDEEYHILFAAQLADMVPGHLAHLAVLACFLAWAWRNPVMNRSVISATMIFGILAAFAGRSAHLDIYRVLRYPILLKYLTALPVYLSTLMPSLSAIPFGPGGPFPEIPYRLLPLLSGILLSWCGFRFLGRHPLPIRIGGALIIAGLPLVRYYQTLFYLEMPAVLCMTLVCFQAVPLLRADPKSLVRYPGWYALLLIGFLKETTLPFLAAFLCCRLLFQLSRLLQLSRPSRLASLPQRPFAWKAWAREAVVFFCVAFPLFLYLFYRLRLNTSRGYHPEASNLLDPRFLILVARSWWDSFGLLLPLSAAGAALLLRRRSRYKWPALVFPCLAFFLVFLFHFLDGGLYVGYSRFNLFLLPALMALAWEALRYGAVRRPSLAVAALVLIFAANLALTPLNPDGSRKPNWGIYASEIGDHSYPYREALACVKREHAGEKIRLTGLYYPYATWFYLGPDGVPELSLVDKPADEGATLDSLLAASAAEGFADVLYHVIGDTVPAIVDVHGYGRRREFRNQAHVLVLFSR